MSEMKPATDGSADAVLRLGGVTKLYGGNAALTSVDFDVRAGEVHALLGENGAGKSTLCKIIAGAVNPDEGSMELSGAARTYTHPSEALRDGISMVYQETSLVPTMTVAQNLELGDEPLIARMRKVNINARQQLQRLNFHVPATAYVSTLTGAQRQMVEIVRAMSRDAKVVIFDEPTASLTPEEKEQLFGAIQRLKEFGVAIIFVSHALEESLQIADRITVLRDGVLQATHPASELDREHIVQLMVGRPIEARRMESATIREPGETVLRVENLTMGAVVKNMSFSARAGEIVGIAGLVGSGRSETALIVAGALKRNRLNGGKVYLRGKEVRYRVPRQAVRDGIVYITEDRKVNGFFETMSVSANIFLGHLSTARRAAFLASSRQRQSVAARFTERFRIRGTSADAKVVELSGGNQQKVVLAKSLTHDKDLVIFDEPTRGVDVGAIDEIHTLIREIADSGAAVVVISSYLPEIMALSDRVLVARAGRIAAEFRIEDATQERIMFAAVH
ncbi:MAG: sugar ABC transporter ATP-binding protein [Cumulibacter sp.]